MLSLIHLKTSTRLFSASPSCHSRNTKKTEKTITHRVHRLLGATNNDPLKLKLLPACTKINTLHVQVLMALKQLSPTVLPGNAPALPSIPGDAKGRDQLYLGATAAQLCKQ